MTSFNRIMPSSSGYKNNNIHKGSIFSPSIHIKNAENENKTDEKAAKLLDGSHLSIGSPAAKTRTIVTIEKTIPETYLVLAILVTFFFNIPCGLFAVCASVGAKNAYTRGDFKGGMCRSRLSLFLSLMGMLSTAVCVIVSVKILL